jgi:hypothetical protein
MPHTGLPGGHALARVARQRAVLTTVADAIVAAAAGRCLRVAVEYTDAEQATFVALLMRALYARGRPCHHLPPTPRAAHAGDTTVAVITSAAPDPDEDAGDSDVCRIDIQLRAPARPAGTDPGPAADGGDDHRPDIVIDYPAAAGPTIGHMMPLLTALAYGR